MANIISPATTGPAPGIGRSATAPSVGAAISPLPIGNLQDWQAAIGAFTILFIIADTSAAPVADVIAWGVALLYVARILTNGSLPLGNLNPGGGKSNGGA